MSKKNLLNESTIRKFMKLASIEPLASDFINKIQEAEEELEEGKHEDKEEDMDEAKEEDMDEAHCGGKRDDEDKMEEELDIDEMGGDMMYKDDEDMDMDMEEPEGEMEMGMGDEAGGKMVDVDAFIGALEAALEKTMGEPAEVEYEEDDMEMDMEEPEGEMEMDVELDADEEEEEEDLAETIYKEVLKRISEKK